VEIICSDDDGFETPISIAPKYHKSRAKTLPRRVWYDEGRLLGGEQVCLKMCFVNMHQFRKHSRTITYSKVWTMSIFEMTETGSMCVVSMSIANST
jgi:hypothetical protein